MKTKHNITSRIPTKAKVHLQRSLNLLILLKPWVILPKSWIWSIVLNQESGIYNSNDEVQDIEVLVQPKHSDRVELILEAQGFKSVWTPYNYVPNNTSFRRYEKIDRLADGTALVMVVNINQTIAIDTITINDWTLVVAKPVAVYN